VEELQSRFPHLDRKDEAEGARSSRHRHASYHGETVEVDEEIAALRKAPDARLRALAEGFVTVFACYCDNLRLRGGGVMWEEKKPGENESDKY
jgi:hypothetical protein